MRLTDNKHKGMCPLTPPFTAVAGARIPFVADAVMSANAISTVWLHATGFSG